MKRLFVVASMAIMAVGCQKTTVENEVLTAIGFNTEVAKQTRAIVNDGTYLTTQPFTVFAYGHQGNTITKVMNGVEIVYTAATPGTEQNGDTPATPGTPAKWAAKGTTKYYWPNDSETTMNFYAYSPYGLELTHTEAAGFTGTYIQEDMYTDFMVATPVLNANYEYQAGKSNAKASVVPVEFNHQLTQIVFNVTADIPGVTATIKSITLNEIGNTAVYTQSAENPWAAPTDTETYTILSDDTTTPVAAESASTALGATSVVTKAVAMIPQALTGKQFTIVYKLEGTGVATETVTKTINLATTNLTTWAVNKKVTYKLGVGLNEITFAPTVKGWEDVAAGDADEDTDDIISIL